MKINYNEVEENSFLQWVVVHFVMGLRDEHDFDELIKITDNFNNIVVDIRINDISIDVNNFFKAIEEGIDHKIKSGLREKVQEFDGFEDLEKLISEVNFEIKVKMASFLKKAGIDIDLDEDY